MGRTNKRAQLERQRKLERRIFNVLRASNSRLTRNETVLRMISVARKMERVRS